MPENSVGDASHPSPKADGSSIVAKLRQETSEAHLSIEQSPPMRAIFADTYTLAEYHRLLQHLFVFYSPFERAVFDTLSPPLAAELGSRKKTGWLRQDLEAAGEGSQPQMVAPVPRFESDEERMGALYVLEGATLGGKLIRKRLLGHFGGDVSETLHFYSGYGAQAGAQWTSFRAILARLFDHADASTQSRVVRGANVTFAALEKWLDGMAQPGHARGALP